jgi:hypothetical protein
MGPPALLPIRRKVCCGFLLPLKIHRIGRFEPATFGSSGKHTNHYTTEATNLCVKTRTILKRWSEYVDWVNMAAHDRGQWRAVVNAEKKFGLHKTRGNF